MSSFLEEMERCIPALRRYARTLRPNQSDADDLVQDCLERALLKRRLWVRKSSMRAWLFTLLHNINVNNIRYQSKYPPTKKVDYDIPHYQPPEKSDVLVSDIEKCLNQLHPHHRQVLLLVVVEGFSYKEVSKIVKIPIGTVMSRISRARENMRILIEGNLVHGLGDS